MASNPMTQFNVHRIGPEIKLGSINRTSIEEQRSTEWMTTQSLIDGLDPENHDLTIEGYPAPHRIVVVCKKYH